MRLTHRAALALCMFAFGGAWAASPAGAQAPEDASAGAVPAYTPTGSLVADSGFRPDANGIPFENYGDTPAHTDLTPASVETLFGNQVCQSGSGASCELIPPAEEWRRKENADMNSGHCYGFSVAALRFFASQLKPVDFGSTSVPALLFDGNTPLQAKIAESFEFQVLDSVNAQKFQPEDPNDMLTRLQQVLVPGSTETWTLGFQKRDGTGGHAVTPYAVEDRGAGLFNVLIYDNNYPKITRAIAFDTNNHTWAYDAQTNPSNPSELYEGDTSTQSLDLRPTTPGLGVQPCPFCPPGKAGTTPGGSPGSPGTPGRPGGPAAPAPRYNEVSLTGNSSEQAHLVIRDTRGHTTGIVGGRLINQIPGANVIQPRADRDWLARQEPKYRIPATTDLRVTIDGSNLTRSNTTGIAFTGPGYDMLVENIKLRPGDRDQVSVARDGRWIVYHTVRTESPVLALGFATTTQAFAFAAASVSVRGGSTLRMALNKRKKHMRLDLPGARGPGGFAVAFRHLTRRGTQKFSHKPVILRRGSTAAVRYGGYHGRKVVLTVTKKGRRRAHIVSLHNQPRAASAALSHAVGA